MASEVVKINTEDLAFWIARKIGKRRQWEEELESTSEVIWKMEQAREAFEKQLYEDEHYNSPECNQ